MNRSKLSLIVAHSLLFICGSAYAQQPKALFYMTRDPSSVRSFLAHADQVDILSPGWYAVDGDGLVSGGPNPLVLETARQHHVPVMPLLVNAGFLQPDFHKLVTSPIAHAAMLTWVIEACKTNGYIGIQLDFENVSWTDRDSLSIFVSEIADALHREHLQLAIATVPNAPGSAGESGFSSWIYQNWRGAYDLKALSQSVDLICLMTYDQQTRWTAPGPVAGWAWTKANLDYALKTVPASKLSLGIPLYGYHWFAGTPIKALDKSLEKTEKPNPTAEYIATQDALDLAKAYGGRVEWDAADRSAWFYFYRDDLREWIFFTDVRTFLERYNLVKDRQLQGFCSWVLGTEDAGIWDHLPTHK